VGEGDGRLWLISVSGSAGAAHWRKQKAPKRGQARQRQCWGLGGLGARVRNPVMVSRSGRGAGWGGSRRRRPGDPFWAGLVPENVGVGRMPLTLWGRGGLGHLVRDAADEISAQRTGGVAVRSGYYTGAPLRPDIAQRDERRFAC
jgi:hypothetical protein